jgi:hypothetical protein
MGKIDNRLKPEELEKIASEPKLPIEDEEMEINEEEMLEAKTEETTEEEEIVKDETGKTEVEVEPEEEVKTEEKKEPEEKKQQEVDYKERYRGSTREAMVLTERNKFYKEAVAKAESLPKPTEEDLVKELGEDEVALMDDKQKQIAIDSLWVKKKYEIIQEAVKKDEEVEKWIDGLRNFVKDPQILNKYPELEGNEEEFVKFAAMPTRIGLDTESLVKIFLFDNKPKPKNKTILLTKSTREGEQKPKKISVEEAAKIRRRDPRLYARLIKENKIDFGIDI